ncbi:MAG: transcriptional regulator [Gloeocapsa sp. DLM2.Bin57]|nr:MAG: transcriptional regulator [Gloeocapsa sp. DLM2.Bin57]
MTQKTQDCELSHLSPDSLNMVADFFKLLSEVTRLQIVCTLKSGPKNVSQIVAATGLGQANVSKHLKLLTDARLLSRSQQGVTVIYEISNPVVFSLCDIVCNSLAIQLEKQQQDLENLKLLSLSK